MRPLTLYVLDRALEQCAQWRSEGIGLGLGLAVNLSARDLCDIALPIEVAGAAREVARRARACSSSR